MRNKILVLAFVFVLIFPTINAFAYEGGLTDNMTTDSGRSFPMSIYPSPIERFTFDDVATINTIKYTFGTYNSIPNNSSKNVKVTFFNSTGDQIGANTLIYPNDFDTHTVSVNYQGVKYIEIDGLNTGGYVNMTDLDFFGNFTEPIVIAPVSNLVETHSFDSVTLSWAVPEGSTGTIIKQNGVEIANLPNTSSTHSINNLEESTAYTFEVIAKYGSTLSESESITVTTNDLPEAQQVTNLNVVSVNSGNVRLAWDNPEQFDSVRIYRKGNSAFASFQLLSETTGETYNDSTVQSDTNYIYKVTTVLYGNESSGMTINATTPEVTVEGVGVEEDENGDYTVTWTEPTTGQMKILVGGEVYATVSAADQQITIPSSDMQYTAFGDPDVELIPLNDDGEEVGSGVGTGGIGGIMPENLGDIGLSPRNLLQSGVGLLGVVGMFVLLGLAFQIVRKLINLMISVVKEKDLKTERRGGRT